MATEAYIKVRQAVYDRLALKKARLEATYKRKFTWSHFLCMLVANGAVERISAQDIDCYENLLEEVRELKVMR